MSRITGSFEMVKFSLWYKKCKIFSLEWSDEDNFNNEFTGNIPMTLLWILKLVELQVQHNQFDGRVPAFAQQDLRLYVAANFIYFVLFYVSLYYLRGFWIVNLYFLNGFEIYKFYFRIFEVSIHSQIKCFNLVILNSFA